jgi:hypothetical protein
VFVSWNRPHKLSGNFDVRFDQRPPAGWSLMHHLGLNVFVQGEAGRAYTPYDINRQNPIGLPYSKNAPFQVTTDLKVNRWFMAWDHRFDVSLQGTNIFNNHVIYRVDPITGGGYVWGQGAYDPTNVNGLNDYVRTGTVGDPSNYGPGAQWRLQLDVDL